jgi:squalene synthase HpnC
LIGDRDISTVSLEQAFRQCEQIARTHYENFPVASLFLPKHLRPYVAVIYAFARTADDFADEGNRTVAERLAALNDWQKKLDHCYEGKAEHPIFVALADVVRRKNIPKQLLSDLLTAFKMDITTHRYKTFDHVLYYCKHSANPVGRLVLHLFDDATERKHQLSDNICTALQLANFWQDVTIDLQKGRSYLPLEDMGRFGYTESALAEQQFDECFAELMKFEVARTRELFEAGKPLLNEAVPQLRLELMLTWNGGITILKKIEQGHYNVFANRPAITIADKISILMKAFLHRAV